MGDLKTATMIANSKPLAGQLYTYNDKGELVQVDIMQQKVEGLTVKEVVDSLKTTTKLLDMCKKTIIKVTSTGEKQVGMLLLVLVNGKFIKDINEIPTGIHNGTYKIDNNEFVVDEVKLIEKELS